MALKDWILRGQLKTTSFGLFGTTNHIRWTNGRKEIYIDTYPYGDKNIKVILPDDTINFFKSKVQALKFAKSYMRTH
jgi:hypothetical protein